MIKNLKRVIFFRTWIRPYKIKDTRCSKNQVRIRHPEFNSQIFRFWSWRIFVGIFPSLAPQSAVWPCHGKWTYLMVTRITMRTCKVTMSKLFSLNTWFTFKMCCEQHFTISTMVFVIHAQHDLNYQAIHRAALFLVTI